MVRWGVLGVAKIATTKVIPAMQSGRDTEIVAIASRDKGRAERAAVDLGIPVAHGSYEALIADANVEAVYIPLPNHLHVPWAIRAAEAGKHVLCEKPIGLDAAEVQRVIDVRDRTGVRIQEAFMVRTHPQWLEAVRLVRAGRLGELRSVMGAFSYYNEDAGNVRNVPEYGGGALMDIGCYLVMTSRWIFGGEPRRVMATIDRDPRFHVDRLTSIMMEFSGGTMVGVSGTQLVPYQRVQIFGTKGRLEIEIPFNAPVDRPCRLFLDSGADVFGGGVEILTIDQADQYTIQGDLFSQAIAHRTPEPYPLEESLANMRIIDALVQSAEFGGWVSVAGA